MRIGIVGASGRVGTRLVELVLANPGLELAAALVSPGSRLVGTPVNGGGVEYRPPQAAMKSHCDVMIDFSTPVASLSLQAEIGEKSIPMIIGTTGFSIEDEARLSDFSRYRPILVSANFAHGFEAFRRAAVDLVRHMPAAEPSVSETYHVRKKADPSGTSILLARQLYEARSRSMGFAAPKPRISVNREGDTVGINELRLDMGSAEITLTYRVHTLAAYAEGALAAAQWLVSQAPGPGRYSLSNCLTD
ncbi:4-hydroxy-tetrahydrodipicolinate reductase [Neorhizobium sp. LjRoot104]|uniref:4-hydroxy-tetrahydrodipicolinate reductase n=1 Tax=Neorhizobium sp. LjRoot104 TaxID=3342254 RepID=UPI003ED16B80